MTDPLARLQAEHCAPTRPLALDLFCCAGGASMGLHRAGFDVIGVDIRPQPRYPFRFVQADALRPPFDLSAFDFIWASPPCQAHTDLKSAWNAKRHEDLIPATRDMLEAIGRPFAIENVEGAPLRSAIRLCGTSFGLGTADAELWRHRHFETSFPVPIRFCIHGQRPRVIGVYGGHGRDRRRRVNAQDYSVGQRREAMGIDWMVGAELSQAIPPAYGEFIGRAALAHRKKGPTAWVRKAIVEWQKGKRVVLVYPVDKWVLMLLRAILGDHASVRNLGDVRWLATEDRSQGKGTGRHIACFILEPSAESASVNSKTEGGQ